MVAGVSPDRCDHPSPAQGTDQAHLHISVQPGPGSSTPHLAGGGGDLLVLVRQLLLDERPREGGLPRTLGLQLGQPAGESGELRERKQSSESTTPLLHYLPSLSSHLGLLSGLVRR